MKKLWIPIVAGVLGLGLGVTLLSLKPLSAHGGGSGGGMGMMGPGMLGWGPWRDWSQQGPRSSDYPNWQSMHEECEEMMERYGYPRYYSPPEGREQETGKALTQKNAVSIVQNYLNRVGNPNLKIGKVEKKEDGNYLVEILTKEESLVDKIVVDRKTGRFTSIYWKDLD
ncbi:MAG: hypothetical protein ACE5K3_08165 [bacterium]